MLERDLQRLRRLQEKLNLSRIRSAMVPTRKALRRINGTFVVLRRRSGNVYGHYPAADSWRLYLLGADSLDRIGRLHCLCDSTTRPLQPLRSATFGCSGFSRSWTHPSKITRGLIIGEISQMWSSPARLVTRTNTPQGSAHQLLLNTSK